MVQEHILFEFHLSLTMEFLMRISQVLSSPHLTGVPYSIIEIKPCGLGSRI